MAKSNGAPEKAKNAAVSVVQGAADVVNARPLSDIASR